MLCCYQDVVCVASVTGYVLYLGVHCTVGYELILDPFFKSTDDHMEIVHTLLEKQYIDILGFNTSTLKLITTRKLILQNLQIFSTSLLQRTQKFQYSCIIGTV